MIRKREQVSETAEYWGIPSHMHGAVERYLFDGFEPGSFLTYLISNDLRGAVSHADAMNVEAIVNYVKWMYNDWPAGSWGSPQHFNDWLAARTMERVADG